MYVSYIWECDRRSEALSSPLKSPGSSFPHIPCDTPKIGEILNATQQYVTMKTEKKLATLWRSTCPHCGVPSGNSILGQGLTTVFVTLQQVLNNILLKFTMVHF